MFSQIGQTIFENEVVAQTSDFNMGLEVEMHRASNQGWISEAPTPAGIRSIVRGLRRTLRKR